MTKTAGQMLAEALKSGEPIDKEKLGEDMAKAMQETAPAGVKVSNFKIT